MFIGIITKDSRKRMYVNSEKKTIINIYKKALIEKSSEYEMYYKDQKGYQDSVGINLFEVDSNINECFVKFENNKIILHEIEYINEDTSKRLNRQVEKLYENYIKLNNNNEKYLKEEIYDFNLEINKNNITLKKEKHLTSIFSCNQNACFLNRIESISDIPFNDEYIAKVNSSLNLRKAINNNKNISIKNNIIFINENENERMIPFQNIIFMDKIKNDDILVISKCEEKLEALNVKTFTIKLTLTSELIEFAVFNEIYQKIKKRYIKNFSKTI
jgi:hypothetical protein